MKTGYLVAGTAVIIATAYGGLALRNAARPRPARAQFPEMRLDVGELLAGDTKEVRFPVSNVGGRPLQFVSVIGDCGCVTAQKPADLAPGTSTEIVAQFNPAAVWGGKMEKGVRVTTNDPAAPEQRLVLTAEVIPLISVQPPSPLTVPYEHGRPYRKRVVLKPRAPGVSLGTPVSESPGIKPRLSRLRAGEYALDLQMDPRSEPGDFSVAVRIPTTEPKIPTLLISVVGFAQDGPVATPATLNWPEQPAEPGRELGRLQVFTRTGKLRILGVETGDPALRTEIIPRTPDQFYEVAVKYAGERKTQSLKRTLRIRTDSTRFPVLSVPLDARVRG